MSASTVAAAESLGSAARERTASGVRISSIDVMRGLVIVLMVVDHVREKIYFHRQVTDPMDLTVTEPALFFTRMSAHLCAPTFVFLAGLAAFLYSHPRSGGTRSPAKFLFTRGLFLIVLEITLINTSWFGEIPPETIWLQVIWAIGLSMIALSALSWLPYWAIVTTGFLIVFGHNLLTPISFEQGEFGYTLWTILHDRAVLYAGDALTIKVSYPVLPWIGVILLGYAMGPLYAPTVDSRMRTRMLCAIGASCLTLLLILRGFNIYGETLPWSSGGNALQSLMSFINFTKYPPSLDFLLLTLGLAFFLMAWFESLDNGATRALEIFGKAPMFIYAFHLYVLLIGYRILLATIGPNKGELFGVDQVWIIWLVSALLIFVLYFPTRSFARFKRSTNQSWVKYF